MADAFCPTCDSQTETIVDDSNNAAHPPLSTSRPAGWDVDEDDGAEVQPVVDHRSELRRISSWNGTEASHSSDFSTLSPNMVVPYVDAKTKAMGVRAELEELRKRSLTKKERSRVLERLSLSDQADPVPLSTQELPDFFQHQRDLERALRQQHRDSIEYLHQYRGYEIAGHAKENIICSKTANLAPAYASMSEVDAFSQQQMDLARESKHQKQFALQNIHSFRSSYPLRVVKPKDGSRDVPSLITSLSLDERESLGLSVLPRLHAQSSADGEKSEEGEERDANNAFVPGLQAIRQPYEDKLDLLTRSPYRNSPFGRESSDSSTSSSALKRVSALGSSPFARESSDCSSAYRNLAVIGSQDMDRSDAHIFEDGEESVDDYDSLFGSGSRSKFVAFHHLESLSGISLPELNAEADTCLDSSPEAAMLIIRAERMDSVETSFDLLNDSCTWTKDESDLRLQPASVVEETVGASANFALPKARQSHIVPPSVRSTKRTDSDRDRKNDSTIATNANSNFSVDESTVPPPLRTRVSGIVPPSRRSSLSFIEDESETDILSVSDCDNDSIAKVPMRSSSISGERSLSVLSQSRDSASKRRKSNLVFPSARSPNQGLVSKASRTTDRKPLKRLNPLRNIFRLSPRTPPSPPLKRVPLYHHHPLDNKREVSTACRLPFIPDLHKTRAGCERCLHWASEDERRKFEQTGHHFRIMMARGGCDRKCAVFPREPDEYPARLCRKCFFDTHQVGKFYTV